MTYLWNNHNNHKLVVAILPSINYSQRFHFIPTIGVCTKSKDISDEPPRLTLNEYKPFSIKLLDNTDIGSPPPPLHVNCSFTRSLCADHFRYGPITTDFPNLSSDHRCPRSEHEIDLIYQRHNIGIHSHIHAHTYMFTK